MIVIERFCYSAMGTFGRLVTEDLDLFTVERPWENNAPRTSCVPEGTYALEAHNSRRYPDTVALVNHDIGVTHYSMPHTVRSTILFHVGNTKNDLLGCIAPGLRLGVLGQSWAVLSSKKAMRRLRGSFMTEDEVLITHYRPMSSIVT